MPAVGLKSQERPLYVEVSKWFCLLTFVFFLKLLSISYIISCQETNCTYYLKFWGKGKFQEFVLGRPLSKDPFNFN